jgi:purine-nucleoside/S-methyl-5'-thioadenosine phosphorylase / adenosine deaminase
VSIGGDHPSDDLRQLLLEVPGFPDSPGWRAGFTTRRANGELTRILPLLGWDALPWIRPAQRHGRRVLFVPGPPSDALASPREADGLATASRGVLIAIAAADCVPIILFDSRNDAGAVLHAGWRGTCAGIAREGVEVLRKRCRSRPGDLRAVIGPSIGPCCYEIGSEVVEAFRSAGHALEPILRSRGEREHLDLREANRRILLQAGVAPERIHDLDLCTRCREDLFPSYRRDGSSAGRLLAFLGSASIP